MALQSCRDLWDKLLRFQAEEAIHQFSGLAPLELDRFMTDSGFVVLSVLSGSRCPPECTSIGTFSGQSMYRIDMRKPCIPKRKTVRMQVHGLGKEGFT